MPELSRRLAAVAMGIAMVVTSSAQVVHAAGTWTGLYVDGSSLEPVSQGLQHLYSPPTDTIDVNPSLGDRSVIAVTVSDWDLQFEDRDGADLAVGNYPASSVTGHSGFHGMVISGPGDDCPLTWWSSFTIRELTWSGVADVASLAIDFSQMCRAGDPPLYGSLRVASSLPIVGIASDPDPVILPATILGVPGTPMDLTFTSIGQAPLTFGTASLDGHPRGDAEIVSDGCSGVTLAPGDACVIAVRLTGVAPMFEEYARLTIPEDSPAGQRSILLEGTVTTETVTTMAVDPERSFWPGNTFVTAEITPRPPSGTVTFHYDDGHGTSGEFSTDVSLPTINTQHLVPRGTFEWTATFEGAYAYLASTSAPITRHVGLETTTALTAAAHPIAVGTTAILRATTTGGGGAALPAGTVTITNDAGTVVGSGPVGPAIDSVEVNVPGLPIGTHQFEATYVSSEDGKASHAGFRLGVSTASIGEAWSVPPPTASSEPAYPDHVAATTTGVFVAGRVYGALDGHIAAGQTDIYVARYSPDGDLLWTRQFGTITDDWTHALVISGGALYVAYGEGERGSGPAYVPPRAVIVKMTMEGDTVWRREQLHPASDPVYLAATPDGGVATSMEVDAGQDRPVLVRSYRADGSVAWQDLINGAPVSVFGTHAWAMGIAADLGGVTVTGERPVATGQIEAFVRRYDHAGHAIWHRLIADQPKEPRVGTIASGAGGTWLGGYSKFPLLDIPNAFPDYNHFVRGFAASGNIIYTADYPTARIVSDCSSFVTVGPTAPVPDTAVHYGATIARSSATGQARWRWEQPGSSTRSVGFRDVAVAGDRVYLLRSTFDTSTTPTTTEELVALDGIPAKTDCDTTGPTTKGITNAFVAGTTVSRGKPSVRFSWSATDAASEIATYDVALSTDGKPYVAVASGLSSASYLRALTPGHTYRLRVRAMDLAGNLGGWTYGTRFRVSTHQETSRSIRWSGSWHRGASAGYWGDRVRYSTSAGAKASLTFTGRSFAWVGSIGPTRGQARVYVNGVFVTSVDLHAGTKADRRVLFSTTWSAARSRTVTIRISGTYLNPRGDIDSFVTGS